MMIIPALLEEDSDMINSIAREIHGTATWLQIDLADGTMTDSQTCDLYDLVGELGNYDIEVHLMTTQPEQYFDACEAIGAQRVYFHLGEVESPSAVLRAMDPYDFTKGIALSPQTAAEDVFPYIDEIDAVQVMTVHPGQQGGVLMNDMLKKVPILRERRADLWISVDGGVNMETIERVYESGVDACGVGHAIARSDDPVRSIMDLENVIKKKYEQSV